MLSSSFFNSTSFHNCSAFSPLYCHIIFPQLTSWTNKGSGFMQLCFEARLSILAMTILACQPVRNGVFFGMVFWGCCDSSSWLSMVFITLMVVWWYRMLKRKGNRQLEKSDKSQNPVQNPHGSDSFVFVNTQLNIF